MGTNNKSDPDEVVDTAKVSKFYEEICNRDAAKTRIKILAGFLTLNEVAFLHDSLGVDFVIEDGEIKDVSIRAKKQ